MGRKTKYNHGKIKKAFINGIPLYHIRLFYLFNHTFNKHAYESSAKVHIICKYEGNYPFATQDRQRSAYGNKIHV